MFAVACVKGKYQDKRNALIDMELPIPKPADHDLLVEIKAVAVNPIDYKTRDRLQLEKDDYRILGWDAAGIVRDLGKKVSLFKPGDEVWFAGDIGREGCNSEFVLVDERITGRKPYNLSFEQASALPLTSLTAWEILFDRLNINRQRKAKLLVIGAAGGVGSILVQLAKQLTQLRVIGTSGREESHQWVLNQGADFVINHHSPLKEQLDGFKIGLVDYLISLTHTQEHAVQIEECLKPQAKFALIDDPQQLDIRIFKSKSISIHWEMMFTRSMFQTEDRIKQHEILNQIAELVEDNRIKTTINEHFGFINADNLNRAHELLLSGKARGKIVLSGFKN